MKPITLATNGSSVVMCQPRVETACLTKFKLSDIKYKKVEDRLDFNSVRELEKSYPVNKDDPRLEYFKSLVKRKAS